MVSCQKVLEELSNYIDNNIDDRLREEIETHLKACRRCSVMVDTTRKVVQIYCDETVLDVPAGYSERLHAILIKAARGEGPTTGL